MHSSNYRSACPPASACRLLADTIPWKIALSRYGNNRSCIRVSFCFASDGNLLAVLGDSHVELRCLDDDFVVAVAKCTGKLSCLLSYS